MVDKDYLLETIGEGKYVWKVAMIPEVAMPKVSFGIMKVKGKIDTYEFSNAHLMPMGNGHLGLPVKAALRKKLKKQAGDMVHIVLYKDQAPLVVPNELLLCMEYGEGILERFETYSDSEKKAFIDWIYSARTEQTKADRIAKTIEMVQRGERFYDKLKQGKGRNSILN